MRVRRCIRGVIALLLTAALLTSCSGQASGGTAQAPASAPEAPSVSSASSAEITSLPVTSSAAGTSKSARTPLAEDISPAFTWEQFIQECAYPFYSEYIDAYLHWDDIVNGKGARVKSGSEGAFAYAVYENGKACIVSYMGKEKHVVIPGQIGGYEVFAVDDRAIRGDRYLGNNTVESVEFPDSVQFLAGGVCEQCYALKTVKLPKNLLVIGNGCFNSCWALKSITLGNRLMEIGTSAFYWCMNLSQVTFGDCLVVLGNSSFAECRKLKSLRLPDSVKYIGPDAFQFSRNLSEVNCPASLEILYQDAFDATKIEAEAFNTKNIRIVDDSVFDSEQDAYLEQKERHLYR